MSRNRPMLSAIQKIMSPFLVLATLLAASPWALADLRSYVKAVDESYGWKIEREVDFPTGRGKAVIVRLTSQTWKGTPWNHRLTVLRPEKVDHPGHALLLIAGGSRNDDPSRALSKEVPVLARIAAEAGSVVAVVAQVPNQPLLGDRYEDALIAYTFEKFMETGDATWPCLLPMTKSAVRAMDAVQALSEEKFSQKIRHFVVTGASKRGWTTWLTGAVDSRVVAIAPMVIDVLNMPEHMRLQIRSFGRYSEQIHDYSDRNLPDRLKEPAAKRLLDLVDPYSYRAKLTMPKLILLGTNDRYWPVDAVKLYFGDLVGEKYIHYSPNTGHGLGRAAVETIAAFYQTVLHGERRPRFHWNLRTKNEKATLSVVAQEPPIKVELWKSSATTRDFREARWTPSPMTEAGKGEFVETLPVPEKGYVALFGRLTYRSSLGHEYTLATNVEVLGEP